MERNESLSSRVCVCVGGVGGRETGKEKEI